MTTTVRIRGLDGLRAIAVALVFLQHKTGLGNYDIGNFGVWLFFVLSGFLIIQILHVQRQAIERGALGTRKAIRTFLVRRGLRIFPIYYLTLVVTLPLFAHEHTHSGIPLHLSDSWYNFAYLSNVWMGSILREFIGSFSHLWSLSVEEQFYLFAAFAFLALPSRYATRACLALIGLGLCTKIALHALAAPTIAVYTNSFVNFAMIAYGGACILSMKRDAVERRRYRFMAPLLLIAYLFLPFALHWAFQPAWRDYLSQLSPVLVGPLLISIVVDQDQLLVRALELWPLRSVGRVSYGFYLYHNFSGYGVGAFRALMGRMVGPGFALAEWEGVLLAFLGTLALAALSWKFIEKPLLKLRS